MRKSFFYGLVTACVIAAIAYGVMTSDVAAGWFWPHVGYNLVWGELGLAVALLVTFPILRRIDLVVKGLAIGAIVIPLLGFLPSMGYQDLQMFRDGARMLAAADLAHLPARPAMAQLAGVWRYDLAATGTYKGIRGPHTGAKCEIHEVQYCRVPIVAADWQPGQPVLAVATCDKPGTSETKQSFVRLIPASSPGLAIDDFEDADVVGKKLFFGTCARGPDTTDPDLAALHFDGARGFFVMPIKSPRDEQRSIVIIECLFAAAALGFALRRKNWRTRIATKREQKSKSG
jgi:hypothetical protein